MKIRAGCLLRGRVHSKESFKPIKNNKPSRSLKVVRSPSYTYKSNKTELLLNESDVYYIFIPK